MLFLATHPVNDGGLFIKELDMAVYTKDDIAQHISTTHGISKGHAKDYLNSALGYIVSCVAEGEEVSVHGFGKFSRKTRPARAGRNPRTGETVQIPAKTALGFKPAKQANDQVGDGS